MKEIEKNTPPGAVVKYAETAEALAPTPELVQAALAVLANLMITTNASKSSFEISNALDGTFKFTGKRIPARKKKDGK